MSKAEKTTFRPAPPPARARPPLPAAFFRRPTLEVARDLIGAQLCRRLPGPGEKVRRWAVTEVEAYDGPDDRACHAHRGRTPRTDIMFAPGGNWYVYLCYGVHWLLNVTTGPVGFPAAVLIRAAGEVSGPGRLTRALQIDDALNRQRAARPSGLWLETPVAPAPEAEILRTPRIGVDYAGPIWAAKPYRFLRPAGGR